ncbi:MAG TPA: hypothetical protein VL346_05235 [Acidobacteriaceae bacterium]|nr:hypothetical protein [Acidobacteriaceae bacterium]
MERMVESRRVAESAGPSCASCVTGRRGLITGAMRASASPAGASFHGVVAAAQALEARPDATMRRGTEE